jgi:hypothetical protein
VTVYQLFPSIVYLLCGLTSIVCACLLAKSYVTSRAPLLLWSAACFALLAANNLVVIVDMLLTPPTVDLRMPRLLLSCAAGAVLLFGFIWTKDE